MSNLFVARPGSVRVLTLGAESAPGSLINFDDDGPGGGNEPKPVIITGIGYNQSVNIQFMPTLRKMVYVYAFGDKMGAMQVQGLAFNNACEAQDNAWGAQELLTYYQEKRAVQDGRTIGINIGTYTVRGFLIGLSLSMASMELKTMAFTLELATLPRKTPGTGSLLVGDGPTNTFGGAA